MADQRAQGKPKVVLVTGAGGDIGRAVAVNFGRRLAAVACIDLHPSELEETKALVENAGGSALALQVDVTDETAVAAAVRQIHQTFGTIDVSVHCHGIVQTKPLLELTGAEWARMFDVNVAGLFHVMREAARVMVAQKRGAIVNIASTSGRGGRPLQAHYAASKAAVINLTRSAALAWAEYGVRVNAVCPGVIDTRMWSQIDGEMADLFGLQPGRARASKLGEVPLGRIGHPEDVAAVVSFLASEEAAYVTGQCLNVCGGLEMH